MRERWGPDQLSRSGSGTSGTHRAKRLLLGCLSLGSAWSGPWRCGLPRIDNVAGGAAAITVRSSPSHGRFRQPDALLRLGISRSGDPIPMKSLEHQARQKVRAATRMLADATRLYEAAGLAYQRPALNAEVLAPIVDELEQRLAEADRLAPLTPC